MPHAELRTYACDMRTAYHEQLSELSEQLGEMCGLAGVAMERATQALLQADLVLAEQVISGHEEIAVLSARAEESAFVVSQSNLCGGRTFEPQSVSLGLVELRGIEPLTSSLRTRRSPS